MRDKTKIKLCGLRRRCDIEYVNILKPGYIGFVFVPGSKRYVTAKEAYELRKKLDVDITPVGVFVDADVEEIVKLISDKVIDIVQLHGNEDEEYIENLRSIIKCPIIQAFKINSQSDIDRANASVADYVLLDSGGGTGESFDWNLVKEMNRPYFLAGGLTANNVSKAIKELKPYAVDASSSLETDGYKDREKMKAFVDAVRERNE